MQRGLKVRDFAIWKIIGTISFLLILYLVATLLYPDKLPILRRYY